MLFAACADGSLKSAREWPYPAKEMFWKKSPKAPEPPPPAATASSSASNAAVDDVLDATAGVLRAFGKHSFTVDEESGSTIAKAFERWAEHVLVAAPPDEETEPGPKREATSNAREWRRLVRWVTEHRKKEQVFVERSAQDAREAIWALVDGVGKACAEHGKADGNLRAQASRLKEAASTESISDLKREATSFADNIVQYLEDQNRRLEEQTNELRERLARMHTQLDDAKREGGTDPLTKLANRGVFDATIAQQVMLASVVGTPLCLVMVDIDHFKSINDRFGHPAGDSVLREFANCLVRAFPRRSDLVARYGGEEFAILLPGTSWKQARPLVERMNDSIALRELSLGNDETIRVTASAGLAALEPSASVADLIAAADRRLYAAKRAGRNRVVDVDIESAA